MVNKPGLNSLMKAADKHHQRHYSETEELEEPEYGKGIPMALKRGGSLRDNDDVIRVDLKDKTRLLFVGESGSGKTRGVKRAVSVCHKEGYNIMNIADSENEFNSIKRKGGASKQMIEHGSAGLLPGEKPRPVPVDMHQPFMLKYHYRKQCSQCDEWFRDRSLCPSCGSRNFSGGQPSFLNSFSLNFSDFQDQEIRALVNPSEAGTKALTKLLRRVTLSQTSFDDMLQKLKEMKKEGGIDSQRAESLEDDLETLKAKRFVSTKTNHLSNVFRDIEDKAVSISVENFPELSDGSEEDRIVKLYIYKVMMAWKRRIERGDLQQEDNLIVGDEAHEFMEAGNDSKLLDMIGRFVNRYARRLGMPVILSTQKPSQLPSRETDDGANILGSITHCFIGKSLTSLDRSEWKPIVEAMNVKRHKGQSHQKAIEAWENKLSSMDQHEFIFIDSNRHHGPGDCPIVEFLSPLCAD